MPVATKIRKPDVSFFAPFEEKSITPSHGCYYIQGYASTGSLDYQGERVEPTGIDLSYFKRDGYIDYEHDMSKTIGVPKSCYIDDKGFYVKAALFATNPYVKKIINLDKEIRKAGVDRHLGYSIEGQVKHRDPSDPSVINSILITGVAVTKNPANTDASWSLVQKSINAYNYQMKHHNKRASFNSILKSMKGTPQDKEIKGYRMDLGEITNFLENHGVTPQNDSVEAERKAGLSKFLREHGQPVYAKKMLDLHNTINKALTTGYGVSPNTQINGGALRPQSLARTLHNLSYSIGDIDMRHKKSLIQNTLSYLNQHYAKDIYSHELALQLLGGCSYPAAVKSIQLVKKGSRN